MSRKPQPIELRFWAKVEKTEGCWIWTACRTKRGYGRFGVNGHTVNAYRFAYELLVGPVPVGLELDHLCRNPSCVNPEHLEPVTHRENERRGVGWAGLKARQTRCVRGHPLDDGNTHVTRDGRRICRTCKRLDRRVRLERAREAGQVCVNCEFDPPIAKGLCVNCYAYRRKFGKDRSRDVQERFGYALLGGRSRRYLRRGA